MTVTSAAPPGSLAEIGARIDAPMSALLEADDAGLPEKSEEAR